MAKNNESTMKWKVDIGQLTKAMQEAKRAINIANAEFKTATAGMDKWSKSTTGLEAKIKQLNNTLPQQKKILADLEKQYAITAENMGENSKEAVDLKIKVEEQKAAIVKTETSINKYNDKLGQMQKEQAESETAYGKLNKTIDEQQSELDDLKNAYKNAVVQYGENSKEAKELASEIDKLSGELADNKKKMDDADKSADDLDKSIEDAGESAEEAKGGFTVLKGAMANLVAQGIDLVVTGLKNLASAAADAWKEFDEGIDIIIAKTGATGDTAKELEEVYKKVSKQVVGSFDDMGTAVGEVNTRFGVTGDDLEDLSVQFLKFAELNDTDVNTAIDKTQSAMEAWGLSAEDTSDFLDVLNKAGQDTGVSMDTLTEALKVNAPAFEEMGFSASDAAFFIANLDKNGIDASSTLTGMKKALVNAAKEGKTMDEALAEMEESIKNAGSSTEAITIATELFGTRSGPAIAKAVRDGKLSFKDLGTTLNDFEGNVNNTFEETLDAPDKFALAIQGIRVDIADMAGDLMEKYAPQIEAAIDGIKTIAEGLFKAVDAAVGFFTNNGDTIIAIITGIAAATGVYLAYTTAITVMEKGWLALSVAQKAVSAAQKVMNAVMSMNPIGLVIAAIAGLVAAFIVLWKKSEAFRNFWIGLWGKIKEVASIAKEKISGWIDNIKTKFQEFKDKAVAIKDGIVTAWNNIKTKTAELKAKVVEFFQGIKSGISEKIASAKEAVSNAVAKIKEFLSFSGLKAKVSELFNGIKEKITSPIEKAKEKVDAAIKKIKGFFPLSIGKIFSNLKLPHFTVKGKFPYGIGGKGEKPSFSVEWYAKGGVFDKGATIAGIGENGAEAVVPLEKNTKWITRVAKEMVEQLDVRGVANALRGNVNAMNGNASSGYATTQNVTFNQYNTSPKAVDRLTLYRETNNLLFSAKVGLQNV
ncbi:phage tail tape measure protein [Anaerotignum sp.]